MMRGRPERKRIYSVLASLEVYVGLVPDRRCAKQTYVAES
jgi:hypothetical protein